MQTSVNSDQTAQVSWMMVSLVIFFNWQKQMDRFICQESYQTISDILNEKGKSLFCWWYKNKKDHNGPVSLICIPYFFLMSWSLLYLSLAFNGRWQWTAEPVYSMSSVAKSDGTVMTEISLLMFAILSKIRGPWNAGHSK